MVPPDVIEQFRQAQRELLSDTYDAAWHAGVAGYTPDEDPHPDTELPESDGHPDVVAAVGLGGLAALLARRARKYVAPKAPSETAKAKALEAAELGLAKMAGELATLVPTAEHFAGGASAQEAIANAVDDWVGSNGWRLNAGDSVAWAGEQDGFAAAASADGMLLEWQTESDERVCNDCEALGAMPPMAEEEWPTVPGAGGTACDVGCRCSLEAYDPAPGDMLNVDDLSSLFSLTADDEAALARIADQAAPDFVLA